MNINFKFLVLGTSLSLFPQYAAAQCAVTDCQQLGYTSLQKCDNGLKCPFGEYWACPQKQCDTSYQYTCTGANEQPGTDKCGDKYKSCACASGYEWKNGKCVEQSAIPLGTCNGYAKNCKIGDILNSNGICSRDVIPGKTALGVVIYISEDGNCGQAMTASPIANDIIWGEDNWVDMYTAVKDYRAGWTDIASCSNTQKMLAAGTGRNPSAETAVNYAPSAAPETKGKWCLPATGVFHSLYKNLSTVNNAIAKIDGVQLVDDNEHMWSSTEYDYRNAWLFCTGDGANNDGGLKGGIHVLSKHQRNVPNGNLVLTIRPVIEF